MSHLREFRLERYFARWEFNVPHLLSASDCETMSIRELLERGGMPLDELADLRLGYGDSQGDSILRTAIAEADGVAPDHVLVTNAPQEAIFLAMTSLLERGDRVVVQTPCYQSLRELAVHQGCAVVDWPLVETSSGWRMDLAALERSLSRDTKLVVLNVPHNPTGFHPTRAEFDAVVQIVRTRKCWLFSDEMYRGLEHMADRRLPTASAIYERAVSLSGTSKALGLAGLRIGWLTLQDAALMQSLLGLKDYTTLCSSGPGQLLARAALVGREAILRCNMQIVTTNKEHLRRFVARHTDVFVWREPEGSSVVFPRLVGGDAAQFCARAAERSGVLLVPSDVFDYGNDHVRFGLGRRDFERGLAALEVHLADVTR